MTASHNCESCAVKWDVQEVPGGRELITYCPCKCQIENQAKFLLTLVRTLLRKNELAGKVVDLVRRYDCCEGDDANQTDAMKAALAAYLAAQKEGV